MKSQDIFILLKLVSLQRKEADLASQKSADKAYDRDWEGWDDEIWGSDEEHYRSDFQANSMADFYTARGLAAELGVSKTEVNASIKRMVSVGLAIYDREKKYPKANTRSLLEFISHGLKYVFPAQPAEIVRGIPTAFAAPVLEGEIMTAGEFIYVWQDPRGKQKGQSIKPLFKSVPFAVKKDPILYELLALVDAVRLGNSREANVAVSQLEKRLRPE